MLWNFCRVELDTARGHNLYGANQCAHILSHMNELKPHSRPTDWSCYHPTPIPAIEGCLAVTCKRNVSDGEIMIGHHGEASFR